MTFLLFLASVAVLEYILGREKRSTVHPPKNQWVSAESGGLMALANAVEQQGRGQTAGTVEPLTAVPKGEGDRV